MPAILLPDGTVRAVTIRLAVFDCDGTLVDGQHAIIAAMRESFERAGVQPPEPAAVRRIVGLPLEDAVARLSLELDLALCDKIALGYKQAFQEMRENGGYHEPLFPGAVSILDRLRDTGFTLGVATGKSRQGLRITLERHGLLQHFSTLKTSDDGPGKPSPHMLLSAMSDLGAEPHATVMVGDTVFDVEMAKSAGVAAIGVGWGYHERGELRAAGAAALAESFEELPFLIDGVLGRT